jgi:hypothetical protein
MNKKIGYPNTIPSNPTGKRYIKILYKEKRPAPRFPLNDGNFIDEIIRYAISTIRMIIQSL